jgi:hypothetical protein
MESNIPDKYSKPSGRIGYPKGYLGSVDLHVVS